MNPITDISVAWDLPVIQFLSEKRTDTRIEKPSTLTINLREQRKIQNFQNKEKPIL